MYTRITASADATIYERNISPDRSKQNTGLDSILELVKERHVDAEYNAFRSRILIKFSDIPTYQGSGEYWLNLIETGESKHIPINFSVDVCRLITDWDMGVGTLADDPITEDQGVSWTYVTGEDNGITWISPGGDYSADNSASLDYEYKTLDLKVNISDIVSDWSASGEPNYGLLIKFSDIEEQASGSSILSYFSTETNTIYQPKLEYWYDDTSFITGSLTPLDITNEILLYPYHINGRYQKDSIVKFRTIGRELYPTKTYVTQSVDNITNYYLPTSSYWAIIDEHTDEYVVPFNETYNKLSCDETSNYFIFDMNNLEPGRYYKIIYKIITDNTERYYDRNFIFEVVK